MCVCVYMSQASSKDTSTSLIISMRIGTRLSPSVFFVVVVVVVVVGARGEPGNKAMHNAMMFCI